MKYQDWLAHDWIFKNLTESLISSDEDTPVSGPGRPEKSFTACSERTKRDKVRDLVKSRSSAELTYAAQMSVRASGSRISSDLLKSVMESSAKAQEIQHLINQAKSLRLYTGEEALALYIDLGLTHNKYKILRKKAIEKGHYLYPSLYNLRKIKKNCIPPDNSIHVDEVSASVDLQPLVNHTAERLLKAPTDTRSFRPFCPDGQVGSRKMVSVWPKTVLLAGVQKSLFPVVVFERFVQVGSYV